jgi:hypothetical protein
MGIPSSVVDALAAAARKGITSALDDPTVIDALLEVHVRQLVISGELVPRDRLRVGAAVELCPAGLERAARAVVEAADGIDAPDDLRAAIKALIAVLEPSQVVATQESEPEATDIEPEVETACSKCGTPTDIQQALLSSTRWNGEVLCRPCHIEKAEKRQKERETV